VSSLDLDGMIDKLSKRWGKSYDLRYDNYMDGGSRVETYNCTFNFSNVNYLVTDKRLYLYGNAYCSGQFTGGYQIEYSDIPSNLAAAFKKLSGRELYLGGQHDNVICFTCYNTGMYTYAGDMHSDVITSSLNTAISGIYDF
jgi:hypothetical protein